MEVSKKKMPYIIVTGIALVGLVLAGYFYYELRKARQSPENQSQKEIKSVVSKVSKLVILPENETPTLATVSDPSVLSGQAFFSNAQVGDKVLIYAESKRAILYNPKLNRVVETAPLSIGEQKNQNRSTDIKTEIKR